MLVLTRKPGESLRIGGEVRITVVSSAGGQVRLAIEAPAEIAILREEVHERIAAANLAAAQAPSDGLDAVLERVQRPRGESRATETHRARKGRAPAAGDARPARWGEP